jgi:hypothetical protein
MSIMDDKLKLLETSVEELLKSTPNATRFFLNWHTACIGCSFARFCTLNEVITTYQLDETKFLEEVLKLTAQKNQKGD